MNIESIWMIVVAVSTPVAGIIAFYLQLKNVRKANLENQKLTHEISKLKEENRVLQSQIKIPSDAEVMKYGNTPIIFRRSRKAEVPSSLAKRLLGIDWVSLIGAFFVIGFIV